jgi:2-methylcitrate dehydratase PrpD
MLEEPKGETATSSGDGAAALAASAGETRRLASFVAGLRKDTLPPEVLAAAKTLVLDLLGCTLGALDTEEARIAGGVVQSLGGREEATAIGFRFRTSAVHAAYLNGVTSHVIEMDDTHRDSITHVGAPVIPAALAVAEREGSDGRAFLEAVIAGYEACLRVANAVQPSHWRRGFLSMGTCGTFGAAAAAGHLLGLDADRLADALGLSGIQAAGLNSSIYGEGDMGKRLCPAHAASTGIMSALLAQGGFTGSRRVIEQRKGFCESFSDSYDLSRVTAGLGQVWEITRTSLKPYACCRYNHAPIDALLGIMQAQSIAAAEIAAVIVRTYDIAVTNRPHRTRPHTLFDAQMSIPFSLAVAAHKRTVGQHDFTEELVGDPELIDFAERVRVEADPAMSAAFPAEWPAEVEVALRDGRRLSRRVAHPKGEPEAAMTDAEVEGKFRDLARDALSRQAQDQTIAAVRGLDVAASVAPLLAAIQGGLTR